MTSLLEAADRLVIRCQDHPTYRGLSKPREDCGSCQAVHVMRGGGIAVNIYGRDYEAVQTQKIARWGSA